VSPRGPHAVPQAHTDLIERRVRRELARQLGGSPRDNGVLLPIEVAQTIADELDDLAACRVALGILRKRRPQGA